MEVLESLGGGAKVDCFTARQQRERIKELVDGVAWLVYGQDYRHASARQPGQQGRSSYTSQRLQQKAVGY